MGLLAAASEGGSSSDEYYLRAANREDYNGSDAGVAGGGRSTTAALSFRPTGAQWILDSRLPHETTKDTTFVVLEVVNGHQAVHQKWSSSTLVSYVSSLLGPTSEILSFVNNSGTSTLASPGGEGGLLSPGGAAAGTNAATQQDHNGGHSGSPMSAAACYDGYYDAIAAAVKHAIINATTDSAASHNTLSRTEQPPSSIVHNHFYITLPPAERSAGRTGPSGRWTPAPHSPYVAPKLPLSRLSARDVRRAFSEKAAVPMIELRLGCILLCLPPLSCIIMHDRVLLLNTEITDDELIFKIQNLQLALASSKQHQRDGGAYDGAITSAHALQNSTSNFMNSATAASTQQQQPSGHFQGSAAAAAAFELSVFEALVTTALRDLASNVCNLETEAKALMEHKHRSLHATAAIGQVNRIKESLNQHRRRAELFDDAMAEKLASPADFRWFQLTQLYHKRAAPQLENEWKTLFDFLDQELEVVQLHIERVSVQMDGTESVILIRLQELRTNIARVELAGGLVSASFAVGTLVSGIFGMNLTNGWESSYVSFCTVCSIITLFTFSALSWAAVIVRRSKYI